MTILVVQNNCPLPRFSEMLNKIQPEAHLLLFNNSPEALAAARNNKIDIAFLDYDLPEMNGLILGQYLKDLYSSINLIYFIHDKSHAFDAMQLRASGCILLPFKEKNINDELCSLRYPLSHEGTSRIFAQTFGNFDLFIDGKPVAFKYSKTKEIVALLINNRGAKTTNGEIIASLWEDDGDPEKKSSYLSNLRQDLQNTLTRYKSTDILLKQRGSMAIAVDLIECDLYDWLKNKKNSRYQYLGDYMNQYSWAEMMHAELDDLNYSLYEE